MKKLFPLLSIVSSLATAAFTNMSYVGELA